MPILGIEVIKRTFALTYILLAERRVRKKKEKVVSRLKSSLAYSL